MNDSAISVRYAKALLQAATEAKVADGVLSDMISLNSYFSDITDFTTFIESPVIAMREKLDFLQKISVGFQDISKRFLEMITRNKREPYVRLMVLNYIRFYRKEKGILEAVFVTAGQVKEDTINHVRQALKEAYKTDVELQKKENEKLIGGFVLRIEDKQLDASIATQLKKIRRELDQTLLN